MYFQLGNEKIVMDFNEGITVKVGGPDLSYYIECVEYKGIDTFPFHIQGHNIGVNCDWPERFFKVPIEFYFDFEINVYKFNKEYGLQKFYTHRYNDYSQLVRFIIDTTSIDEAYIWLKKIGEYQSKHSCKIQIFSDFDEINEYSDTKFATRNLSPYKTYRLGRFPKKSNDWKSTEPRKHGLIWYGNWKTFWSYQHPRLFTNLSSEEIANDILGL
jgi:hypothetical protein